jgi:hypothetical protein
MRKFLLIAAVFFVSSTVLKAQVDTSAKVTLTPAEQYLQTSKQQKTTAFIFLGLGVGCLAIAAPGNVSFNTLPVLVIGGAAATIASIPLFIASAKNKRKARQLTASLKNEKLHLAFAKEVYSKKYLALSFKLAL